MRLRVLARFGRTVELEDVAAVETHDDLSRHVPGLIGKGFWIGVRRVPGRAIFYNLRARRGVTIAPREGERIVVGSERPEELAAAVRGG